MDTMAESESPDWSRLGFDLIHSILSLLPLRSILRAGAVCRLWRSVVTNPCFSARVSSSRHPWLILVAQNNAVPRDNRAFGFDPHAGEWVLLPPELFLPGPEHNTLVTSGYFLLTCTSSSFKHAPLSSRVSFKEGPFNVIAAGGVLLLSTGDDIYDRPVVEVYDKEADSWKLCPPLPEEYLQESSARCLTSALVDAKIFVFGIYSGFISSFDLRSGDWSEVHTLRPPGVRLSFLLACNDRLVLAGLRYDELRGPSFNLWRVEKGSMEFAEMAIMPQALLHSLFDGEKDDDDKMLAEMYASLKSVGMANLIYVFNEAPRRAYPACVCEIISGGGTGQAKAMCRWRRIPDLPAPVDEYDKVMGFISTVPLRT